MITKINLTKDKEYKFACLRCDNETFHKVLMSYNVSGETEYEIYSNDYEIVSCQGCQEISFRSISSNSEDYDEEGHYEDIHLYPNRIMGRKQLDDIYLLPLRIRKIYVETHNALCAKLNILTGIGIRTLIESVCRDKNAIGNNLEEKIKNLVTIGVLSSDNANVLDKTRLFGNKIVHEAMSPTVGTLYLVMDIVENLVSTVYIIPEKAKHL